MAQFEYPDASESSMVRGALSCLAGLEHLADGFHGQLIVPFGILAGTCLELTLKSHVLQSDPDRTPQALRKQMGHDLVKAWQTAAKHGPPVEGPPPDWVIALNEGHSAPYTFRYLPHLYGAGVPPPEQVIPALRRMLDVLRRRSRYLL